MFSSFLITDKSKHFISNNIIKPLFIKYKEKIKVILIFKQKILCFLNKSS